MLAGSLVVFTFFTGSVLLTLLNHTLLFDGYAANGAFQLLNPLRRLAAGEAIGNDFNFFHGVGVPLIHLPFYYLFGQGFLASEASRWLVSPLLFVVSTFVFFYAFRRKFVFAANMAAITTILGMWQVSYLIYPVTSLLGVRSVVPVFLMTLMLKQDRLRRPLWRRYRRLRAVSLYEVLCALLLAIGFICGTEFGTAAILGFLIANSFYRGQTATSLKQRLLSSARVFGMMVVSLMALLTVITRGRPLEPLKFALGDVPADQFWYFGVPPNTFMDKHTLLPTILHDDQLMAMLAFAVVAVLLVVWLHRLRDYRTYCQAFIFGLLAGTFSMVSMLGYFHSSEASALVRMSLLVGGASVVLLYGRWQQPIILSIQAAKGKKRRQFKLTARGVLTFFSLLFVVLAAVNGAMWLRQTADDINVHQTLAKTKRYFLGQDTSLLGPTWHTVDDEVMPIIQADNTVEISDVNSNGFVHGVNPASIEVIVSPGKHASFIRPGQIVYLHKTGRQIIKSVRQAGEGKLAITLQDKLILLDPRHDGAPSKLVVAEDFNHDSKQVWMLYSSLIDQEMGTFQPTSEGYDYIIHALGKTRRQQYVDEFKQTKPQFVLTLTRPYFRYEEWVQNSHWDFYTLLDENYEVVKQTSIYNVWKRRDQPWSGTHRQSQPWKTVAVDQKNNRINLPNMDFTNAPDVDAFSREQQKAQIEARQALGFDEHEPVRASEEDYDLHKMQESRAARQYELRRSENFGLETDRKEQQDWLTAARSGRDAFEVPKLNGEFNLKRPKRQVMLVRLHYTTSHPLSKVPIFGKTTRYLAEPNNVYSQTAISLRPYDNVVTFPLVISEYNHDPYLRLASYSMLPGEGTLKVTKAEWMPLDTSTANLRALTDRL